VGEIVLPKREQGQNTFQIGARITAGRGLFHKTKILTLTPRYTVKNELDAYLEIEECDEQGRPLPGKESFRNVVPPQNTV
jgi:hypothetical protein